MLMLRGSTKQGTFAQELEVNPNTLRAYEEGRSLPNQDVLSRICVKLSVSPAWLLLGQGPMKAEAPATSPSAQDFLKESDSEFVAVSMVEARLSAGGGSLECSANIERRYTFRRNFLQRKGQAGRMVLMRVTGDSMEPEIQDGDMVLLDQSQNTPRPGLIYAVSVEDMIYLKEVNAQPGKLVLSSYNPAYAPIEVDMRGDLADAVKILGRVVWLGREFT